MKDSIQIVGFGVITEKQAMGEIAYFASVMQDAYKNGRMNLAIQAMKSMKPFVEALQKKGYSIEQIMPEGK
jgi:hypothetical protein